MAQESITYRLSALPENISFKRLIDFIKLRWHIERDSQQLKREVGVGHFKGRTWRGFHRYVMLFMADYKFLVSDRKRILPKGLRFTGFFPRLAAFRSFRPRSSATAAPPAHPQFDQNHAPTADCGAGQKPPDAQVQT